MNKHMIKTKTENIFDLGLKLDKPEQSQDKKLHLTRSKDPNPELTRDRTGSESQNEPRLYQNLNQD